MLRQLLMVMLFGYVALACACAVQCLQAAIQLKEPRHQPSVQTLEKIIRNLDTLDDIGLVSLPTREVLRRHNQLRREGSKLSDVSVFGSERDRLRAKEEVNNTHMNSGDSNSNNNSSSNVNNVQNDANNNNNKGVDPRTSKEARELIAAETFKAAIPTKEMEVIEWEQALFRAAKRALARSKVPSQRALKAVRTIQRSSSLKVSAKGKHVLRICACYLL